jgi:hypothetical protein
MKIESKIGSSSNPAQRVYNFISDFRNFNNFIPEDKISNWESDINNCRFKMDLIGNISLKMVDKDAPKLVKIESDPEISQYNFTLWIQIKKVMENSCKIKVTIEPHVNQIMLSLVKSPLKSFVDSLVDEIEKFDFTA